MSADPPLAFSDSITVTQWYFQAFPNTGVGTYTCRVTLDSPAGHDTLSRSFLLQ